ncbi:hypothetical protein HK096_002014, partial [Nowakowskiella sp. JEL0078]
MERPATPDRNALASDESIRPLRPTPPLATAGSQSSQPSQSKQPLQPLKPYVPYQPISQPVASANYAAPYAPIPQANQQLPLTYVPYRPVTQPIAQPPYLPVTQPIAQPPYLPVSQPIEPPYQSFSQTVSQPPYYPIASPLNKPLQPNPHGPSYPPVQYYTGPSVSSAPHGPNFVPHYPGKPLPAISTFSSQDNQTNPHPRDNHATFIPSRNTQTVYSPIPTSNPQGIVSYVPYNPRAPSHYGPPPPRNTYTVPPNVGYAIPPQNAYSVPYQPIDAGRSIPSGPKRAPWNDTDSEEESLQPHTAVDREQIAYATPQQPHLHQTTTGSKMSFTSLGRSLNRSLKRSGTGTGTLKKPNVPGRSFALDAPDDLSKRTNHGNTGAVMTLLADMWIVHTLVIFGFVYLLSFVIWTYDDTELWNWSCYYKIGWLLPTPYTLICLLGLIMPYRTPRFIYNDKMQKRRCDNLYILTVTRGNNREAVYRSWNAHRHLETIHPSVRVHVLTDEPFFFENINCYTCPKGFSTNRSKYKARALEWYRQTMAYTEYDWVLHLDEESVIDDESVRRVLEFIWYETDMHMGQGPILYNQYRYWKNWLFTVADALRVGDDLSRFHLQLTFFKRPIWGCHGSFLLVNGLVENSITWDLGSLTEDYEFAMAAWKRGFKVGKVPGFIREQSPQGVLDFMKQRRRWFIGIWRLKHPLPKIWAMFWTLGSLCLFTTIASFPLGVFYPLGIPRWFGLLKDMTSATFLYLYILGVFVQDLDKGKNPILVLVHIPLTLIVSIPAVLLETISVIYGIIFPPKDFDVIK